MACCGAYPIGYRHYKLVLSFKPKELNAHYRVCRCFATNLVVHTVVTLYIIVSICTVWSLYTIHTLLREAVQIFEAQMAMKLAVNRRVRKQTALHTIDCSTTRVRDSDKCSRKCGVKMHENGLSAARSREDASDTQRRNPLINYARYTQHCKHATIASETTTDLSSRRK